MRKLLIGSVAFVAVLLAPIAAQALPLLPGMTHTRPGLAAPNYTLTPAPVWFSAPNMVATFVSPYITITPPFTGALTSTVYADPNAGPTFGFLGFDYVWTNTTPGAVLDLVRTTVGGANQPWLGVSILDAGSDTSGSSTEGGPGGPLPTLWSDGSPNFLLRDPAVSGAGLTVQWRAGSVGTVIRNPSDFSAHIWFLTDEKYYQFGRATMIDSGKIAAADVLVPGVPEPATLSLLGLGLLAAARRRRK